MISSINTCNRPYKLWLELTITVFSPTRKIWLQKLLLFGFMQLQIQFLNILATISLACKYSYVLGGGDCKICKMLSPWLLRKGKLKLMFFPNFCPFTVKLLPILCGQCLSYSIQLVATDHALFSPGNSSHTKIRDIYRSWAKEKEQKD